MPKYSDAFPDFPPSSLPPLPTTWEDTSWHNDMCPSWCTPTRGYQVYVDYEDTSLREFPDGVRYSVLNSDGEEVLHTDVWEEVLKVCE